MLTGNPDDVAALPFFISYGRVFPNAMSIPDRNLLWEHGISERRADSGTWEDLPVFFPGAAGYSLPFDLFSALFYLISRYEEYLDFTPDKHDRYPASASMLALKGLLERPIADEWLSRFFGLLEEKQVPLRLQPFRYIPSYDIDIAYSYKYKGAGRTVGALGKDILNGKLHSAGRRFNVLSGRAQDPYDCFAWLQHIHEALALHPYFFVLSSLRTTAFDKNIAPLHPRMSALIRSFTIAATVGLHPSYYAQQDGILEKELAVLEKITGSRIIHSRQHYIRLRLPETYRLLAANGITNDWSMGYGAQLGFRAGTGRSFYWYDLSCEQQTGLRVHPFCFMDSTAHFEEGLSVTEAFSKLETMKKTLEQTSSQLVTVFHNFSLGSEVQWKGWREAYEGFLRSVAGS